MNNPKRELTISARPIAFSTPIEEGFSPSPLFGKVTRRTRRQRIHSDSLKQNGTWKEHVKNYFPQYCKSILNQLLEGATLAKLCVNSLLSVNWHMESFMCLALWGLKKKKQRSYSPLLQPFTFISQRGSM